MPLSNPAASIILSFIPGGAFLSLKIYSTACSVTGLQKLSNFNKVPSLSKIIPFIFSPILCFRIPLSLNASHGNALHDVFLEQDEK